MALKTVLKKVDDLDGKELPDGTKPWRVNFQGKKYDLLLAPENRKKVEEYWHKLTKDAVKVKPGAAKRGAGRPPEELARIREWLREQGHEVQSAGMIKKALIAEYDSAHGGQKAD